MKSLLYALAIILIGLVRIPAKIIEIRPAEAQDVKIGQSALNGQISQGNGIVASVSQQQVIDYVYKQAKAENVDINQALWIVKHESQDGQRMIGDNGNSLGVWQLNIPSHPELKPECAMDLICSTKYSLNLLAEGKSYEWSTWRFRKTWFPNENPPE